MFNFDSQNLSGYRDTAGDHKTQAIVEVFFIEGFRSLVTVWDYSGTYTWSCYLAVLSSCLCVQMCMNVQWLEQGVKLQP